MAGICTFDESGVVDRAKRHLSAADAKMATIIKRVGAFTPGCIDKTFDALVRSIIHQQISMAAARTIQQRVKNACANKRITIKALTRLSEAELRAAGLSRQKVGYMRSICEHFQDGLVQQSKLKRMSDAQVIESLTEIKGVGVWTAEMILMFNLKRTDVWPVDDLGIRTALQKNYRAPAKSTRAQLIRRGEKFRPYRTFASWYLWRSLEGEINPGFE